ncbi:BCL-6 corepressor-like protein 1 [Serinus canaria]|uniref:BCL-6 corepressor-like protein 1 n=1 Tax=Serinus canaria TaxID=9135 RepID=UPI0021CCC301|nr:BCL-6 corepressor-like protein 1 [Serinus canaria]XP_050832193.1 BCL-6 corepressor-like protein 1 [Serinus canaria]XP_050832231.1 BCL-6 corepressor-like protein 1 [Serinus canaria]XP_050832280.1 BCL-6 corepressor-like protein 1 [Serinus canaria]XP_050832326.1 BCL-6 corepressor-like protein 1 [Serinus canaria]XP_050832364.1 BCL-6 corepressor-like protein 1 [Serinus canaria]XP_050832400.1 BCL-6 corepressor-like protein 1 [Serinus canaria]XP_050832436.1 BCL-6 corepressor-like protein 1 [Seri
MACHFALSSPCWNVNYYQVRKISHLEEIKCHCHWGGGGQPVPGRVTQLHLVKARSNYSSWHLARAMPGKNGPDFTDPRISQIPGWLGLEKALNPTQCHPCPAMAGTPPTVPGCSSPSVQPGLGHCQGSRDGIPSQPCPPCQGTIPHCQDPSQPCPLALGAIPWLLSLHPLGIVSLQLSWGSSRPCKATLSSAQSFSCAGEQCQLCQPFLPAELLQPSAHPGASSGLSAAAPAPPGLAQGRGSSAGGKSPVGHRDRTQIPIPIPIPILIPILIPIPTPFLLLSPPWMQPRILMDFGVPSTHWLLSSFSPMRSPSSSPHFCSQ